jgi:hypothetical protein
VQDNISKWKWCSKEALVKHLHKLGIQEIWREDYAQDSSGL